MANSKKDELRVNESRVVRCPRVVLVQPMSHAWRLDIEEFEDAAPQLAAAASARCSGKKENAKRRMPNWKSRTAHEGLYRSCRQVHRFIVRFNPPVLIDYCLLCSILTLYTASAWSPLFDSANLKRSDDCCNWLIGDVMCATLVPSCIHQRTARTWRSALPLVSSIIFIVFCQSHGRVVDCVKRRLSVSGATQRYSEQSKAGSLPPLTI